jgi:hypothetical protein
MARERSDEAIQTKRLPLAITAGVQRAAKHAALPAYAFARSLPRRACAATKASAAGVMPSMRPA